MLFKNMPLFVTRFSIIFNNVHPYGFLNSNQILKIGLVTQEVMQIFKTEAFAQYLQIKVKLNFMRVYH